MPCAQFPLKVMQIACWVKVQINPMNREAFYCSKRHKMINPAKVSLSLRLPLLSFFSTAVLWYLIDMSMEPFFQSSWFHAPRQWRIFAREGSKLLFIHQEGQAKGQNICLFGKLWSDLCSLKSFSLHLISQFPFNSISFQLLQCSLLLWGDWPRHSLHWRKRESDRGNICLYVFFLFLERQRIYRVVLLWIVILQNSVLTWDTFALHGRKSSARTAIANSAPWIVLCPTGHLGPLVHHFARAQQRGHSSQTELMTQNQCFCFWTGPFSLLYFMPGRPQSEGLFAATWSTIWAKFHICWANCKKIPC